MGKENKKIKIYQQESTKMHNRDTKGALGPK
jgi:hypothetical protein